MIELKNKTECCGCSACASVCHKKCISMVADEEGFLYPKVDESACVECGLCKKVCPVLNYIKVQDYERKGIVLRAKGKKVVKNSTSGGFFTPVAEWILGENGVVCAASFDNQFNVQHQFITKNDYESNVDVLDKFRGSKYVQSNMCDCYEKIREYLNHGTTVCFIGTTCQVYGLKCFLKKEYENLFTVDLVCHGTPSPKLWKKYLDYQIQKKKGKIKSISFRSKQYGYHNAMMEIQFTNRKRYLSSARTDIMLKCFFREIASRPICYQCPFKTINRISDLTVYDCWHSEALIHVKDDNMGFTNVIIQSAKGEHILSSIKNNVELYDADLKSAVKYDGIMIEKCAVPHPRRNEFYQNLDKNTLPEHIKQFLPIHHRDYFVDFVKKGLYKTGLLKFIKKG